MKHPRILLNASIAATAGLFLLVTGCAQNRLAMDYQIKLDREFGIQHVKETETFHSGEKFLLRVTTHSDGYLYILNRGTSGRYNVLYPRREVNNGSAFVPGWQYVTVPAHGSFQFDVHPGVETMIICSSRKAVPQLDRIVLGTLTDPKAIEECLHDLSAESKHEGSFTKTHHPDHTQVVLMSPKKDAVMVNTIRLAHTQTGRH